MTPVEQCPFEEEHDAFLAIKEFLQRGNISTDIDHGTIDKDESLLLLQKIKRVLEIASGHAI